MCGVLAVVVAIMVALHFLPGSTKAETQHCPPYIAALTHFCPREAKKGARDILHVESISTAKSAVSARCGRGSERLQYYASLDSSVQGKKYHIKANSHRQ